MPLLLHVVTLPISPQKYIPSQKDKIFPLVIKILEVYTLYFVPFQCHQPASQMHFLVNGEHDEKANSMSHLIKYII